MYPQKMNNSIGFFLWKIMMPCIKGINRGDKWLRFHAQKKFKPKESICHSHWECWPNFTRFFATIFYIFSWKKSVFLGLPLLFLRTIDNELHLIRRPRIWNDDSSLQKFTWFENFTKKYYWILSLYKKK